jgi:Transposase
MSDPTARTTEQVDNALLAASLTTPRIGIDEISYRKGQRYLLVVTDHDTGRLVWAGKDRTAATLRQFFNDLGPERAAALTHVSADGAEFIHTVVSERALRAVLCLDAFYADLQIMPTEPRQPTVCPGHKGERGLLSRHNPGCVSETSFARHHSRREETTTAGHETSRPATPIYLHVDLAPEQLALPERPPDHQIWKVPRRPRPYSPS